MQVVTGGRLAAHKVNIKNVIIGCLTASVLIILAVMFVIVCVLGLLSYYNSKPLHFTPNIQPKIDIHMPPTSVHVHPRQSAFKCTNCGAKFYINVKRKLTYRCPSCHKFTLVPDDL